MSEEYEFEDVTTDAAVATYEASSPIFKGLIKEIRELSRKKPDATMSAGKVKIVNRILNDLLNILKAEPTRQKELWNRATDALGDRPVEDTARAAAQGIVFRIEQDCFNFVLGRACGIEVRTGCECLDEIAGL